MEYLHNAVGFVGAGLIIIAYFLLQTERLSSDQLGYSMLNLIGASGIMFSLFFEPNTPSIIIESFWVLISLIGIYKCWSKKRSVEEALH